MFIPSTLGTISDSLDKIFICQWWRVYISSEILTVAGRNGLLHLYFFNWREGAWLSNSAIFEPVETQKKSWNLFTSWLLCRSAIIILSLITSNAFCHLLVTNLHLADYQRSPNQWVIGVEDCADNPGNESTEKLTVGEESLPVVWDPTPSASLPFWGGETDLSQTMGWITPASVMIPQAKG